MERVDHRGGSEEKVVGCLKVVHRAMGHDGRGLKLLSLVRDYTAEYVRADRRYLHHHLAQQAWICPSSWHRTENRNAVLCMERLGSMSQVCPF